MNCTTDSGAWTAQVVTGKVYVAEKNGNKGLLLKRHRETVSFIPSGLPPSNSGYCTIPSVEPSIWP